jgi:hypothetical protein
MLSKSRKSREISMADMKSFVEIWNCLDPKKAASGRFSGELLYRHVNKNDLINIVDDLEINGVDASLAIIEALQDGGSYPIVARPGNSWVKDWRDLRWDEISQGEIRAFFLFEKEFFSCEKKGGSDDLNTYKNLEIYKSVIDSLSKAALRSVPGVSSLELIFVGDKGSSLIIETKATEAQVKSIKELSAESLEIIQSVGKLSQSLLDNERRSIFHEVLVEHLKDKSVDGKCSVFKLIESIDIFNESFKNEYKTFLCSFSFKEAKREIVESEVKFCSELESKNNAALIRVIVALMSVIGAYKLLSRDSGDSWWLPAATIIFIGILFIFYCFIEIKHLNILAKSKEIYHSSHLIGIDKYPEELKNMINENEKNLKNAFIISRWFNYFIMGGSFALVIVGVYMISGGKKVEKEQPPPAPNKPLVAPVAGPKAIKAPQQLSPIPGAPLKP